jgi:hypothetical protein
MFQTAFQANAFQNNAFQIVITPTKIGGDDAPYTKEELKRLKGIQKKLRQAEEKRIEALKTDAQNRKQTIADLVDPKPVVKQQQKSKNNIQSNQEVSVDIPSNLANIDRYIANLVAQQQDLQNAVLIRSAKLRLEQELAILEAKRQAELDDEEALLALIL